MPEIWVLHPDSQRTPTLADGAAEVADISVRRRDRQRRFLLNAQRKSPKLRDAPPVQLVKYKGWCEVTLEVAPERHRIGRQHRCRVGEAMPPTILAAGHKRHRPQIEARLAPGAKLGTPRQKRHTRGAPAASQR